MYSTTARRRHLRRASRPKHRGAAAAAVSGARDRGAGGATARVLLRASPTARRPNGSGDRPRPTRRPAADPCERRPSRARERGPQFSARAVRAARLRGRGGRPQRELLRARRRRLENVVAVAAGRRDRSHASPVTHAAASARARPDQGAQLSGRPDGRFRRVLQPLGKPVQCAHLLRRSQAHPGPAPELRRSRRHDRHGTGGRCRAVPASAATRPTAW